MLGAMAAPNRVHCSYHKCLTVYFGRVMRAVFNRCLPWSGGFRHYNSHLADFYDGFEDDRLSSINNRGLDLDRLGDFRLTRFVRDPRDLVVSGYFYHRRGAEAWTTESSPTEQSWYFANGCVPTGMEGTDLSFAQYLQSLPEEDGLLAELEFRRFHFESMEQWPADHPRISTFRYEDFMGSEVAVFDAIFDFLELSVVEKALARHFVKRYSLARASADAHVRDPKPEQWRTHFTPAVRRAFDSRHGDLLRRLGYSAT